MQAKAAPVRCRAFTARPAIRNGVGRHQAQVLAKAELTVGSTMSDFPNYYKVLKNQDGQTVTLSSFQNKAPVVLFFYPKAASPGCTAEACAFRDAYNRFSKAGVEVFGISSDPPAENKAFKEDQSLQYDLLTDENSILRKEFGIKNSLLVLPGRQTYVISKEGKCIMSFNDMMNSSQHISEALKALGIQDLPNICDEGRCVPSPLSSTDIGHFQMVSSDDAFAAALFCFQSLMSTQAFLRGIADVAAWQRAPVLFMQPSQKQSGFSVIAHESVRPTYETVVHGLVVDAVGVEICIHASPYTGQQVFHPLTETSSFVNACIHQHCTQCTGIHCYLWVNNSLD
eukprot:TRINITY_DN10030_c0_g1_i1.p1 TRINITY_DN10030_c0_g1~~TRINITY_DN10030_c0_g1_i1.p1  ORF type:complete len:341 (-),score=17.89 TRINITY_DN10030_c0_g1_i1:451-1473(-)